MGRVLVMVLVLVGCETRYGTPVDPASLGYHPCVAAGDCVVQVEDAGSRGVDGPPTGDGDGAAGEAFAGRWAMIETQAVTTVDMPFVGVLETTSVHHYLVDIVADGDALVMHQRLCELEIFEQTCHNMGITVIPPAYVDAITPFERRVFLESGEVGAGFVSERVTRLRGAALEDIEDDPMPTLADPTGSFDQDGDGHPGMTVLLNGVFAGSSVYTAQRWWTELDGTIVTPDYIEGPILHANETNTLGADPPALAYQTQNAPHEDPTRSFFRMVRVADETTCADLIEAAYGDDPCPGNGQPITDCPMRGFDHLDGVPILWGD